VNDRPSAEELLRAVEHFLETEVVPALGGVRRFHARVAANVTAMVARELETEDVHDRAQWERLGLLLGQEGALPTGRAGRRAALTRRNAALAERIRAGDADAGELRRAVLEHLRRTCDEKLEVSRPPRQRGR
jgi:hypothetical protein